MIEREPGEDWHDLQNRVAAILGECGLKPEVTKVVGSVRGENEIDVYATDPAATPNTTYFCECKHWKSRVPQAEVHTFVNIVGNAGAHVGLFISSSGFQAGALEVVRHTNVHLLTWEEFQTMFMERWCRDFWVPAFRDGCDRLVSYVEPINSDAARRLNQGEPIEPAEALGLMAFEMWIPPFNELLQGFEPAAPEPLAPAIGTLRDKFRKYLPPRVAEAQHLRDLLDESLKFADEWAAERKRTLNNEVQENA